MQNSTVLKVEEVIGLPTDPAGRAAALDQAKSTAVAALSLLDYRSKSAGGTLLLLINEVCKLDNQRAIGDYEKAGAWKRAALTPPPSRKWVSLLWGPPHRRQLSMAMYAIGSWILKEGPCFGVGPNDLWTELPE